ncbi:T9SS type A sorting domain-containing protein [Mariniflexile soesokkakense]|uniref:T9SS type A sorting domain-containing protein n=1 Tax=Mariniflexile soesokkakense TaxID=1343160 RepID=A0ABV0AC27_9FLAO
MKNFTLLFIFILTIHSFNAQTIAWSSDSEDLTGWGSLDNDGDTFDWGVYGSGAESFGFNTGALFFSESWSSDPAPNGTPLSPDNYLFTPTFIMPATATSITYKMKVAALDAGFFAEKFAVYVYDDNDLTTPETLIHEETLTAGGAGSAKDITATIPVSFADKTLGIIIRHFDCTDQNQLLIDDFEVSYSTSLSTEDNELKIASVSPNPFKDIVTIETNTSIDGISVINQLGQQVLKLNKSNIFNNKVDLSSLTKGFYFMNVKAENKTQSIKIIKE